MPKRILYLGLDPTHYSCKGQLTHWPIIQIIPKPLSEPIVYQALRNFQQYSHIILTSKSTVAILRDYLLQMEIDLQLWAQKLTIAVGRVTAQHLQDCGITPIKVAQEETAEGLIHELRQLPLKEAHVFWPHSAQARSVIKDFLVTQKICHTTCVLYDSQPQFPQPLPALGDFDEIVFTSPSTVKAFLQIFGQFPPHAQLIAIGPVTAHFLETQRNKDK